jgi:translation initiation factor IF-2
LTKLRVYEYAKQLNMSSKEIITILNRLDVPVANHMSVMDNEMVAKVEQFFRDVKQRAAERHANEVERELREKQRNRERAARQQAQAEARREGGGQPTGRDNRGGRPVDRPRDGANPQGRDQTRVGDDRVNRPSSSAGGANSGTAVGAGNGRGNGRPQGSNGGGRPADGGRRDDRGGRRGEGSGMGRPDRRGGDRPGDHGGNRGGRPGGGFGGNRGGRPGGRPGGFGRPAPIPPAPAVAANQGKGAGGRKEKERGEKEQFDRKEKFNEEKLLQRQSASRRRGQGQGGSRAPMPTKVTVEGPMTVGDFAKLLHREASEIIKKLMFLGIMATINQEIDTDAMELIAGEFGVELEVVEPVDEEALDMLVSEDKPEDLKPRPPVVTIMGHVDHGKTTLLDAIRHSRVAATESGGITQHIGAYQVDVGGRKITFLDTPGHEAFTTMRARGAQVTDVTILVVAADDGVMPQTVEAINHAKAANVPIIVAVNKIDKPGANPDKVKQELTQYELVPEEWGGDTIFVEISALKREGLDNLLEMVLLVADIQELKANPDARPRGTVIEAKLDKGRGPVATLLVQNGTLRVGDIVVAGTTYGRVRAMVNDLGKRIKEAGPSMPVEIQGLGDVPSAGDRFVVYDDERAARALVQKRLNRERAAQMEQTSRVTLNDLYRQIQEGDVKELNVIVKADVQGSVEAVVGAIEKIDVEGVRVKVIHKGVGAINENDVLLAHASNAVIIGFHVRPDANARRVAEAEKVDIRLYRVIYNVTEELEAAMKGMLDPEFHEVVIGHAEVREIFHISRVGTVAGCYVTDGKMTRDAEARVIRDGVVVYEGSLDSLKRFKDDVREVAQGFECGLTLERFNDIKVGDVIEAFKMEAVKKQ